MKSDLERIEFIASAAQVIVGDELAFAYPKVLDVIRRCTEPMIAVLGVEVFVAGQDGYQTEHLSTYDI